MDASAQKSSGRLLSLDVFRGITIAFMVLVNSPGNETSYVQLDHAEWSGWTLTDLVFPFFVFIIGVSLVFSLSKRLERGASHSELMVQIAKRGAILFGLGLLLNAFPYTLEKLSALRFPGVLQRLAICYVFGAVFYLKTGWRAQLAAAGALLIGYWLLMTQVAAPGYAVGDLTKEGNLAAYIDRLLLAGHIYRPQYDPEGILSTLPAIASVLIGNLAGMWLASQRSDGRKVSGMLLAGIAGVILGQAWNAFFPINKALWTSSYVLFTGGLALWLLAACYWLIDVKGWRGPVTKFFEIFGVNAIAVYMLHIFFLKLQNLWKMPRIDGTPGNARLFVSEHLFRPWMSAENASLAYALSYTLIWAAVLAYLYRKKIFLKV